VALLLCGFLQESNIGEECRDITRPRYVSAMARLQGMGVRRTTELSPREAA